MRRYDSEDFLADVLSILTAQLNSKIDSVEAEKVAKGMPASNIKHIDFTTGADGTPNGVVEQTFSDKILNTDPCLFFGIEDIKSDGIGPTSSQTYRVFIDIITIDSGNDATAKMRIQRYSRALKEVIEENYDKFSQSNLTKIETVRPISFKLDLNSSETYKVGGVSIITTLA